VFVPAAAVLVPVKCYASTGRVCPGNVDFYRQSI
jgi:hypothetical protein